MFYSVCKSIIMNNILPSPLRILRLMHVLKLTLFHWFVHIKVFNLKLLLLFCFLFNLNYNLYASLFQFLT